MTDPGATLERTLGPELARRLAGRRMILTSTTGRSGTGFLSAALGLVPGMVSLHEPKPWLAEVLREVQGRPEVARRFLVERKLPAVAAVDTALYAETSHLYCKGFLEPLLDLGLRPDLIVLERPARQVASSLYRLEAIPGRTPHGLRWYLFPADPGVLPLPGWRDLHDYQLCYWYCLEIERRNARYETLARERGARVVRATLQRVRTVSGLLELTDALALPRPGLLDRLRLAVSRYQRINAKRDETRRPPPDADLEELERQVEERVGRAGAGDDRGHPSVTR